MSRLDERIVISSDDHGEKKFVTGMVMGSLEEERPGAPSREEGCMRKKTVPAAV